MRRYENDSRLTGGTRYGTATSVGLLRSAISSGTIACRTVILTESQRLDVLAGIEYGNGSLWWILAAASNIGWGLQVPPGTVIKIPRLDDIRKII